MDVPVGWGGVAEATRQCSAAVTATRRAPVSGSAITRNRLEPHGRSGHVGNAQLSTLSGRYSRESGGDGTRAIG